MVWHRVNKVIAEGKTKTTVILYSYKIAMQVHNKTPGKKCTLNSNNLVLLFCVSYQVQVLVNRTRFIVEFALNNRIGSTLKYVSGRGESTIKYYQIVWY